MAKRLRSLALWDSDAEEAAVGLREAELHRENKHLRERVQLLEAELKILKAQTAGVHAMPTNGDEHVLSGRPCSTEKWLQSLRSDVLCLSRLYSEILTDLQGTNNCDGHIHFEIPRNPKATASQVSAKVEASVAKLWAKHPAVFKVGITSNPVQRWMHQVYGYSHDRREKWQGMNILFVSPTSLPAAFIETMLISRFRDSPGCRNENPGGETASPGEGPHFVYVVYRILYPPPRVPCEGHA